MRMRGYNVLHPFGWDAFGLPAENAAIKNNVHPEKWTLDNIAHMKGQLQRLGISYAWGPRDRDVPARLLPLESVAVHAHVPARPGVSPPVDVNWCETDQTVLANEQVVDGGCWRCGTPVTIRELEQWFLRITAYADELVDALPIARRLAGKSADDAAQLDRTIRGRARPVSESRAVRRPPVGEPSRCSRRASTRSTARRSCCSRQSTRSSSASRSESAIPSAFRARVAGSARRIERRA
jgi:leucyl-tRNA synthetase